MPRHVKSYSRVPALHAGQRLGLITCVVIMIFVGEVTGLFVGPGDEIVLLFICCCIGCECGCVKYGLYGGVLFICGPEFPVYAINVGHLSALVINNDGLYYALYNFTHREVQLEYAVRQQLPVHMMGADLDTFFCSLYFLRFRDYLFVALRLD